TGSTLSSATPVVSVSAACLTTAGASLATNAAASSSARSAPGPGPISSSSTSLSFVLALTNSSAVDGAISGRPAIMPILILHLAYCVSSGSTSRVSTSLASLFTLYSCCPGSVTMTKYLPLPKELIFSPFSLTLQPSAKPMPPVRKNTICPFPAGGAGISIAEPSGVAFAATACPDTDTIATQQITPNIFNFMDLPLHPNPKLHLRQERLAMQQEKCAPVRSSPRR